MAKYFTEVTGIEDLRKLFKEYCLELHPDKGGKHEDFIQMKDEYDNILTIVCNREAINAMTEEREAKFNFESETGLYEIIIKLMNIPGIEIEICGSWLWVGGNTFPIHEQLKELGCKYSKSKKKWYFSPYMSGKKRRGIYTMQKIRDKFGSEIIESEAQGNLLAAA